MIRFEEIQNKDLLLVFAHVSGTNAATATNYGKFFTAHRPYEVVEISEVHAVAGSNGGAVTLNIERLRGTQALDAGDSICVAGFNLKSTANTVVFKKYGDLQNSFLLTGDRLALEDIGTLTDVADVEVTLLLKTPKGDYR